MITETQALSESQNPFNEPLTLFNIFNNNKTNLNPLLVNKETSSFDLFGTARRLWELGIFSDEDFIVTDKEIKRLEDCKKNSLTLECPNCETFFLVNQTCKSKACPHCRKIWSSQIFKKYSKSLSTFKKPRFITLTVRNTEDITKQDFKNCTKHFNKLVKVLGLSYNPFSPLRNKKEMATKQTLKLGRYIYTREVKYTAESGFNLHIHCLYDGDFIPVEELSYYWEKISGSFIVDVRRINDAEHGLKYISKYISKGSEFGRSANAYVRFLNASRGMRLVQTSKGLASEKEILMCKKCGAPTSNFILIGPGDLRPKKQDPGTVLTEIDDKLYEGIEEIEYFKRFEGNMEVTEFLKLYSEKELNSMLHEGEIYTPRAGFVRCL